MKQQLEILVRLQELDDAIRTVSSVLETVQGRLDLLDQRVVTGREAVETVEAEIVALKKTLRQGEQDIQDLDRLVSKNKEKSNSVSSNKEYHAVLKEIDQILVRRSDLEDEVLKLIDRIETAEAEVRTGREDLAIVLREVEEAKEAIRQGAAQNQARLADLMRQREEVAGQVRTGLLSTFSRIQERVRPPAITSVEREVCNGCNTRIPPQMYLELRNTEELNLCPHCQRIIYWKEKESNTSD